MHETRLSRILGLVALLLVWAGCGASQEPSVYSPENSQKYTGTKVESASKDEAAVLQQVDKLVTGKRQKVGGVFVVADAPYFAASGRTCRSLLISSGANRAGRARLACEDGSTWFWAPEVMAPEAR